MEEIQPRGSTRPALRLGTRRSEDKPMRVLVGCEYSGVVRDAFFTAGHDAWSCDLEESEGLTPWRHIHGDIRTALREPWDLIILHPPCTYLAVSGNRWYANTYEREQAIRWTMKLWRRACQVSNKVALENPVGVLATAWRRPNQYIQPWEYGHPESKRTGLWLRGLPNLKPTTKKPEEIQERIWRMAPGPNRSKERSRFYTGIAEAMAKQWT